MPITTTPIAAIVKPRRRVDIRSRRIGFTEKINPANPIASPTYTTAEASILSDLPGH